ncbi:MAG: RimK family alpha-L-glutamate ligase [Candidatus Nanohaloarchaea archaeon]
MKLLKITGSEYAALDSLFDETEHISIEALAPEVIDGEPDVKFNGSSVAEYDAVFAEIPTENALFGRVALEMIEEMGVRLNYPSTGFFIMSKKNYLYHVLHEKDVPAPKTAVVATEKAVRNIERQLKGPLVARKFEESVEIEKTRLETVEDIQEFAEGIDRGNQFVLFQELRRGDKYRCLVAGDTVISLADNTESWRFSGDNLQYHTVSKEKKETVLKTRKAIGTPIAEVLLRGDKVEDVNPNPDLELYTELSGKNAYETVAEVLKPEEE